jgi:hypothetical protein
MIERQIVGAAIRIFGLWRILLNGVSDLYLLFASHFDGASQFGNTNASAEKMALLNSIFNLVAGILIIVAAPAIVRMIYRDEPPAPQT